MTWPRVLNDGLRPLSLCFSTLLSPGEASFPGSFRLPAYQPYQEGAPLPTSSSRKIPGVAFVHPALVLCQKDCNHCGRGGGWSIKTSPAWVTCVQQATLSLWEGRDAPQRTRREFCLVKQECSLGQPKQQAHSRIWQECLGADNEIKKVNLLIVIPRPLEWWCTAQQNDNVCHKCKPHSKKIHIFSVYIYIRKGEMIILIASYLVIFYKAETASF